MKLFRMGLLILLSLVGFASALESQQTQQANTLAPFERRQGYVLLFDGLTLDHFTTVGSGEWKVVDGTIVPTPGSGNGQLATTRSFSNFHFEIDFLAEEGANGGVFLRVPAGQAGTSENAFEVQIFDADPQWQTGAIVGVSPATKKVPTVGEWHNLDILAIGGVITIMIDETTVVDVDIPARLPSGPIHLALPTGGRIQFRNVRILPL